MIGRRDIVFNNSNLCDVDSFDICGKELIKMARKLWHRLLRDVLKVIIFWMKEYAEVLKCYLLNDILC